MQMKKSNKSDYVLALALCVLTSGYRRFSYEVKADGRKAMPGAPYVAHQSDSLSTNYSINSGMDVQ